VIAAGFVWQFGFSPNRPRPAEVDGPRTIFAAMVPLNGKLLFTGTLTGLACPFGTDGAFRSADKEDSIASVRPSSVPIVVWFTYKPSVGSRRFLQLSYPRDGGGFAGRAGGRRRSIPDATVVEWRPSRLGWGCASRFRCSRARRRTR